MNIDTSIGFAFVIKRASAEVYAANKSDVSVEALFLALLKLAEVNWSDITDEQQYQVDLSREIITVHDMFRDKGIDTTQVRGKLRAIIAAEKDTPSVKQEVEYILGSAAHHAGIENKGMLDAPMLLSAIFRHPTALIELALNQERAASPEKGTPESPVEIPEKEPVPQGLDFLPYLSNKIRRMRCDLLDRVYGQDHAVYTFSEGMFASEVLAAADESRQRPRAIFVFAGPPGVGKTFLAQEGAKALGIPSHTYDMSSYADNTAHLPLIGFPPSYKDAKPGILTGFVKENPHSVLIFDEIEKAHINTIRLFLQILDAGRLHDEFLDQDISFRDTVVIFTTNAGRQLYESENGRYASELPRQTILNAIETDKDEITGQPLFPTAICSRLGTGWVLMFNHLTPNDLTRISSGELKRFAGLVNKQYGIRTEIDDRLASTLLFAESASTDARRLRAQTEVFCKNELFKLCSVWTRSGNEAEKMNLQAINFRLNLGDASSEIRALYENPETPTILLFGKHAFAERCRTEMPQFRFIDTCDKEEAVKLAVEQDILFVLLDLSKDAPDPQDDEALFSSSLDFDGPTLDRLPTLGGIEQQNPDSIIPSSLRVEYAFVRDLRECMPELGVYLLESNGFRIDNELMTGFSRLGCRGKLLKPESSFGVFADDIETIAENCFLEKTAASLAAEHRVLSFDTDSFFNDDGTEGTIVAQDLVLKRAVAADDMDDVILRPDLNNLRFADVIGADDAKDELQFFMNFLQNPKQFLSRGLKPPKGVLLYGPPGTGKTMMARAMAGECGVTFIPAAASSFVTKWQGSGPEAVRTLFRKARSYAPSIIFIDEIDAIGRERGSSDSGHGEEMALNALLTEMDGFSVDPKRPVFVLAATNFDVEPGSRTSIDPALSRRFDRKIKVDLPTRENREAYIRMMLARQPGHQVSEEMIVRLASRSSGTSLAILSSILDSANRLAVRKNRPMDDECVDEAFEEIKHGARKDWGEAYMMRVARHEAGHALLCYFAGRTPAYLTIVARGGHGGYMEHADIEDTPMYSREEIRGRIRTSLGGRASELVYYGTEDGISTGASGDLESATNLALAMLCSYGMGEEFGLAVLDRDSALHGPMSADVHQRINAILREEMDNAVTAIRDHKDLIDTLVDELLKKNRLAKEELEAILSGQGGDQKEA